MEDGADNEGLPRAIIAYIDRPDTVSAAVAAALADAGAEVLLLDAFDAASVSRTIAHVTSAGSQIVIIDPLDTQSPSLCDSASIMEVMLTNLEDCLPVKMMGPPLPEARGFDFRQHNQPPKSFRGRRR